MPDVSEHSALRETVRVAAPPYVVWSLVSDVTRMGEWSPETTSCRWVGGATGPEVGSRFVGTNRNKVWRWSTRCRVTEAIPGEVFAFDVSFAGMTVSHWRYDIRPLGKQGCEVAESTIDRRRAVMKAIGPVGTGVADRASRNRETMRATLAALASAAASIPTEGPRHGRPGTDHHMAKQQQTSNVRRRQGPPGTVPGPEGTQ